jgi:hypothetical protein
MVCLLVLTISLSRPYKLPDYTTFKLANGLTVSPDGHMTYQSSAYLIPAGAINDKDKSDLLH